MLRNILLSLISLLCFTAPALAAEPAKPADAPRPPVKAGRIPLSESSGLPPAFKTLPARDAAPAPKSGHDGGAPQSPGDMRINDLAGLWKADVARTKELFGKDAAPGSAENSDARLEFDVPGKAYRVWKDAAKTATLLTVPLDRAATEGNRIVLHGSNGKKFSLEFLDADSLVLVDKGVVLVRDKPGMGE